MIEHVATPDGRTLEIMTAGPQDGFPFLFHSGTPSAVVPWATMDEAAEVAGLRMVTLSRPGYGASSPRPQADSPWSIADDVADAALVLDALGLGEFVTLGWSGGGPRALGCAALLPGRCRAATLLAGVAPYGSPDLDWTAGMGPENVRDFDLALQGRESLRPVVQEQVEEFAQVTGVQVVAAFGGLVDEVDAAALTGEFGEHTAAVFRRSCEQGDVGLLEDNLQIVAPWGFEPEEVTVPVSVWQGAHDKMVPFAHGEWLVAHLPGAVAHLFADEGHLSLFDRLPEMLLELRSLAGLPPL